MLTGTKKLLAAIGIGTVLTASLIAAPFAVAGAQGRAAGKWVTGDFHTHTYLTDGEKTEFDVVDNAFRKYGLDWMANSEHGGTSKKDPFGNALAQPVWRWITLSNYSYPMVSGLRKAYPQKKLIQGVEWNVPTHEHASVGIVADEPTAISNFEYMFDASDKDTGRASEGLAKQNATHADAVAGAAWLESNYKNTSYYLLNHPSRQLKFSVADIRDFNNAAPDVAFGFEGIPGHQKESSRGGYGSADPKAQTYGGADYMIAQVGGLWDALLGEGRNFWVFANSDFHNTDGDFWPGEYEKNYTYVTGSDYQSLVAGFRSGNSFAVEGDLINGLNFTVKSGRSQAAMGQDLTVKKGGSAVVTIMFKSPKLNNNGDRVQVDHIDLIAGDVTGKAAPGTDAYSRDTNDTARVVARFTTKSWKKVNGWYKVEFRLDHVNKDQYFRLRGTNLGLSVANQTDAAGNPLSDALMGANDAAKAYQDLWFYSNPIFVSVK